MTSQGRNFNPHKEAVIAMWLFGKVCADRGEGSMDFYDSLSDSEKRLCKKTMEGIEEAPPKQEDE